MPETQKLYQVQIQVVTILSSAPFTWQDMGEPMTEKDADEFICSHQWLDAQPPVMRHYTYRKVLVS